MEKEKAKAVGYRMGTLFAEVIMGSAMVFIVALTVKFLVWLF